MLYFVTSLILYGVIAIIAEIPKKEPTIYVSSSGSADNKLLLQGFNDEENFPFFSGINWSSKENSSNQCSDPKLVLLRKLMRDENITGYLIKGDAHEWEYMNECTNRRKYISGFTGSLGSLLITENVAVLFTDGRYQLQAKYELDSRCWIVDKNSALEKWVKTNAPDIIIGVHDGTTYNSDYLSYLKWFKNQIRLINKDLAMIVRNDQDPVECEPKKVMEYPEKYAGESWVSKVEKLRKSIKEKNYALILSDPTQIAWLFNLRGGDVPYKPVVYSYAIINETKINFYIDQRKLCDTLKSSYQKDCPNGIYCIDFKDYDHVDQFQFNNYSRIIYEKSSINMRILNLIPAQKRLEDLMKNYLKLYLKNKVQLDGMREAQYRDSIAIIEACAQLEHDMNTGTIHSEISAANIFEYERRKMELFQGLSFQSISAYGSHGALAHYGPTVKTNANLSFNNFYVIDSGGQYLDGTTDVTRTLFFGTPTEEQKSFYTSVLKNMIDFSKSTFYYETILTNLEVFARRHLWNSKMDTVHSFGHGIGQYLGVHETPISPSEFGKAHIKHGFMISIEPGLYVDEKFGIRLENIGSFVNKTQDGKYLNYETFTLVPFESKLIKYDMLDAEQIAWLKQLDNNIRKYIYNKLTERAKKYVDQRQTPNARKFSCEL